MLRAAAPSTAHQLRINLVPGERIAFNFEPPGYQLHLWREDSGLITHTAVLGDWPGATRTLLIPVLNTV